MSDMSTSMKRARWHSTDMAALFILGLVGGIILGWSVLLAAAPAYSTPPEEYVTGGPGPSWQQPYGGCDEAWQAPQSTGADDCRAHGWTVKWWIVESPKHRVEYVDASIPQCANEDRGRYCTWNFYAPRWHGLDYWFDGRGRAHYVKQVTR
jgi:hypothetical protein